MSSSHEKGRGARGEAGEPSGEHPWGDVGQIIALAAFLALWILDSFVLRISTGLAGKVPLPARLAASGLVLASAVLFMRGGHRATSHNAALSPGLITDGAFARVRHPLYAGSLLFYLALVIGTLSLVSLAAWCGIFVFYDVIASFEERGLAEAFGPAYQAYRGKVPKWLPRLRAARFG